MALDWVLARRVTGVHLPTQVTRLIWIGSHLGPHKVKVRPIRRGLSRTKLAHSSMRVCQLEARASSGVPAWLTGQLYRTSWGTHFVALVSARPTGLAAGRIRRRAVLFRPQAVEGAPHPVWSPVQHVRVDHGGLHIAVPKQLLNGPDVVAVFQQVRREGMPEGVAGGVLRHPGAPCGLLHGFLQYGFVQMVAAPARCSARIITMSSSHEWPAYISCSAQFPYQLRAEQQGKLRLRLWLYIYMYMCKCMYMCMNM